MKKYFYSDGKEKQGPYTIEELKNEGLNPDTLIWYEGLEDWTPINKINELEEFLHLSPPPFPTYEIKHNLTENVNESIDKASENNEDTTESFKHKKQRMFSRSFSFNGRIRRTEYGISFIISAFLLGILKFLLQEKELALLGFAYIPSYWFLFAQGAKRCHDMGQSGWWQIIPFYPIWLIFCKGEEGIMNKYGVNPKY